VRLESRVTRLEAAVGTQDGDSAKDLPYSWEEDWTEEELSIVVEAIMRDEDPPEELVKKAKLTRTTTNRLAGMTEEEIQEAVEEIKQKRRSYYEENPHLYEEFKQKRQRYYEKVNKNPL